MADFLTEFPEFDAAYMPTLPAGFVDESWHNDACPYFANHAKRVGLFIDHYSADMRELGPDAPRFVLVTLDEHGAAQTELVESDDWQAILDAIDHLR